MEHTVLIQSPSAVAMALKEVGNTYYTMTKDDPNHPYGPPHLNKGMTLLEEITKHKFTGEALILTQAALANWLGALQHASRDEIADVVRQRFSVEAKTKDEGGSSPPRINYHFEGAIVMDSKTLAIQTVNQFVARCLRHMGATSEAGAAPPNAKPWQPSLDRRERDVDEEQHTNAAAI